MLRFWGSNVIFLVPGAIWLFKVPHLTIPEKAPHDIAHRKRECCDLSENIDTSRDLKEKLKAQRPKRLHHFLRFLASLGALSQMIDFEKVDVVPVAPKTPPEDDPDLLLFALRDIEALLSAQRHLRWSADYVTRHKLESYQREAALAQELALLLAEKVQLLERLAGGGSSRNA